MQPKVRCTPAPKRKLCEYMATLALFANGEYGGTRFQWQELADSLREFGPENSVAALKLKESDGKSYVKYQVIGANSVAVPTHFYKVVVGEAGGALDMEAYVMPNQRIPDETPVASFMVPPESVEKAAGLLFFDKIQRSKLNKINGKKV